METPDEAFARTRERFPGKPIVFVTTRPLDDPSRWGLTLRYESAVPPRDFKEDEAYSIFTTGDVRPAR